MKRYRAHEPADEGFYLNPRRLAIKSLEERGLLPGEVGDAYVRIPVLAVLPIGLALSLAYVLFLPLVGFLMLGRLLVEKLHDLAAAAARSGIRVLQPAWLPARAYLSRGQKNRQRERDDWADKAAKDLGRPLPSTAELRSRERGWRKPGSDTRHGSGTGELAHEALAFELVDRCMSFRKSFAPALEAGDDSHCGADLAAVHRACFGEVARDAAAELLGRLQAAGIDRGLVVDLAARSGILCRRVMDAGFEAFGIDLSPAMLRIARTEVPEATFVRGSAWDLTLPAAPGGVVAVAAVGEAFSGATEPAAGLSELRRRLASIHRALVPGGLLLFDVAGPGRCGTTGFRERCFDRDGALLRVVEREDRATGSLDREITMFLPLGHLYRRVDEAHHLTLYDPERVGTLLAGAGFGWERLSRYRETELSPGWHGFVARKPLAG